MQIETKVFGLVDYEEQQILEFKDGILGFPGFHKYVLLQGPQFDHWELLQSLDDPDLSFLVLKADVVDPEYKPAVSKEDLKKIGLEHIDQGIVLTIITIREGHENISANLQGPIIINASQKLGMQALSNNDAHPVRFYFFRDQGGQ